MSDLPFPRAPLPRKLKEDLRKHGVKVYIQPFPKLPRTPREYEAMSRDVLLSIVKGYDAFLRGVGEPLYRHTAAFTARQIQAAHLGHVLAHGDDSAKAARWRDYQSYLTALAQARPGLSYFRLCALTAKHFNVSPKTIRRHTFPPESKR